PVALHAPRRYIDPGRHWRRLQRRTNLACRPQGTTDERILGIAIEREQPGAMLAIDLIAVTDALRAIAKYLGALRAPDPHLVVDHSMASVRETTTMTEAGLLNC
ncbi:MAG TPA: hypothetical protein VGD96_06690, partial [Bradyrhizobium sp.]